MYHNKREQCVKSTSSDSISLAAQVFVRNMQPHGQTDDALALDYCRIEYSATRPRPTNHFVRPRGDIMK